MSSEMHTSCINYLLSTIRTLRPCVESFLPAITLNLRLWGTVQMLLFPESSLTVKSNRYVLCGSNSLSLHVLYKNTAAGLTDGGP